MTRAKRRRHLVAWLILTPLMVAAVAAAVTHRPPLPAAAPAGTPR
jgi:hypothetical protein